VYIIFYSGIVIKIGVSIMQDVSPTLVNK